MPEIDSPFGWTLAAAAAFAALAILVFVVRLLANVTRVILFERYSLVFWILELGPVEGWHARREWKREGSLPDEGEALQPLPEHLRGAWYATVYRFLGTPHVRLTGLSPDAAALHDGRMLRATADWWNRLLDSRPALEHCWCLRRIDETGKGELLRSAPRENASLARAVAYELAPLAGPVGNASFALACAFAKTWEIGVDGEAFDVALITAEDLAEANRRYGFLADTFGYEESPGWWQQKELEHFAWQLSINAIRWAYADQVKRWEREAGMKIGEGIGFGNLEEGRLVERFADLLFERGARFAEAEERAAAEGGSVRSPLGL